MRPVEYCEKGFYGRTGNQAPVGIGTGMFHGFYSEGDLEGGIECYALVECDDGTVKMMATTRIKFIASPERPEPSVFQLLCQELLACWPPNMLFHPKFNNFLEKVDAAIILAK